MGLTVELTAGDGHRLSAYQADPAGQSRGSIVVIQEIFGLTRHIRGVADEYAGAGFTAIAPALFDRIERNVDVPYSDPAKGVGYMQAVKPDVVMLDIQAAIDRIKGAGKVGVVGYCWGGTMTYLASARLHIDAAVSYYAGGVNQFKAEKPRCPVMFHFGEKDTHIPLSVMAEMQQAVPEGQYFSYPAEHGFNCGDRPSFNPQCSALAFERSSEFFHQYVG